MAGELNFTIEYDPAAPKQQVCLACDGALFRVVYGYPVLQVVCDHCGKPYMTADFSPAETGTSPQYEVRIDEPPRATTICGLCGQPFDGRDVAWTATAGYVHLECGNRARTRAE